jgi:selenide,water dikinase
LRAIIQGGLDKLTEAGVVLIGGHSIEDQELKYGLAVTGFVHPQQVLTKRNLTAGDRLVLTKPLGTGVINTAIKGGLASPAITETVTQLMATLNRDAATVMKNYPVHACTDITGFGLLGHLTEMVVGSGCSIRIDARQVPILAEAIEYAGMGLMPAGAFKNREFRLAMIEFSGAVDPLMRDLLFDPQTSGGLLISVAGDAAEKLLEALKQAGIAHAAIIGDVLPGAEEKIRVGNDE